MKITRRQLRRLINEAIKRVPVFEPVSREEVRSKLDQKRAQSRGAADIDPIMLSKIGEMEALGGDESNQARSFAQALGSMAPAEDVTYQEEDEYADEQIKHYMEYFLGPGVRNSDPSLLRKMKKMLDHYSNIDGKIEVWIFDGVNYPHDPELRQPVPEEETAGSLLEALKNDLSGTINTNDYYLTPLDFFIIFTNFNCPVILTSRTKISMYAHLNLAFYNGPINEAYIILGGAWNTKRQDGIKLPIYGILQRNGSIRLPLVYFSDFKARLSQNPLTSFDEFYEYVNKKQKIKLGKLKIKGKKGKNKTRKNKK